MGMIAPRLTTCPECNTAFSCGAGKGNEPGLCWCQDMAPLGAIQADTDCLCPDCLKGALAREGGPLAPKPAD